MSVIYGIEVLAGPTAREIVLVGEDEAKSLLLTGQGVLAEQQHVAPVGLLSLLDEDRITSDIFGPRVDSPKRMQRVAERVVCSGVRQFLADGHQLSWIDGSKGLYAAARRLVFSTPGEHINILEQFQKTLNWKMDHDAQRLRSAVHLSLEEQRSQNVVSSYLDFGVGRGRIHTTDDSETYWRIGADWCAFYDGLKSAFERLKLSIDDALMEGRIICSQQADFGDRYVPPKMVGRFNEHKSKQNWAYLFACNLPSSWFQDLDTLPERRAQAVLWINKAGQCFAEQGRRATKADLQLVASERFDLSPNAISELWPKCVFPGKGVRGSIPTEKRVSISEIRGLE